MAENETRNLVPFVSSIASVGARKSGKISEFRSQTTPTETSLVVDGKIPQMISPGGKGALNCLRYRSMNSKIRKKFGPSFVDYSAYRFMQIPRFFYMASTEDRA